MINVDNYYLIYFCTSDKKFDAIKTKTILYNNNKKGSQVLFYIS